MSDTGAGQTSECTDARTDTKLTHWNGSKVEKFCGDVSSELCSLLSSREIQKQKQHDARRSRSEFWRLTMLSSVFVALLLLPWDL